MTLFGLNGAALAARGERPEDFGVEVPPFGAKVDEGVKLGESTLRRFFILLRVKLGSDEYFNRHTDLQDSACSRVLSGDVGMCNLHN